MSRAVAAAPKDEMVQSGQALGALTLVKAGYDGMLGLHAGPGHHNSSTKQRQEVTGIKPTRQCSLIHFHYKSHRYLFSNKQRS